MVTCKDCGSNNIVHDYDNGEIVCGACGTVIEQMVDSGSERSAYDFQQLQDRARTGAPLTMALHDKGLSTIISTENRDAFGAKLNAPQQIQMHRLRKWQIRSRCTRGERSLVLGLGNVAMFGEKLNLSEPVIQEAARIFRSASLNGLVRGRSVVTIVSAAIYATCRELKIPRSIDEITEVSRVSRKDCTRCYRLFLESGIIKSVAPLPSKVAVEYIKKVGNTLGISGDKQGEAIRALQFIGAKKLTGKDPRGLAGAALYLVCSSPFYLELKGLNIYLLPPNNKLKVTQKDLSSATDVTEVTIRNRAKELQRLYSARLKQEQANLIKTTVTA